MKRSTWTVIVIVLGVLAIFAIEVCGAGRMGP